MNLKTWMFLLGSLSCMSAQGQSYWERSYFELQGQAGVAEVENTLGEETMKFSSGISGTLESPGSNTVFEGSVGAGYVMPIFCQETECLVSPRMLVLPKWKLALNGYGMTEADMSGFAYSVIGSSVFTNHTYDATVDSFRIILDATFTLLSWQQWSITGLIGTGPAWNTTNFKTTPTPNPFDQTYVEFNENTKSEWAWEAGVGIRYQFTEKLSLSLDYLYADLGKAEISDSIKSTNVAEPSQVVPPPAFDLKSNTYFLSVQWILGS